MTFVMMFSLLPCGELITTVVALAQLSIGYVGPVDSYDDPMSKMALALTSSQVAKNYIVEDFGIGEDLPFTFFFWTGGTLYMAVQLRRERMTMPVEGRIDVCREMCSAVCSFWDTTAISFIAEGFESLDKSKLNGRDLRQAFIEGEELVSECLTVTHCEKNLINHKYELTLLSLPYEYELGRKVDWGRPVGFTNGMDKILKTSAISRMLMGALENVAPAEVEDDDFNVFLRLLSAEGFNVELFF